MKIIIIADAFARDILGGGELNNDELSKILSAKGHQVEEIHSHKVTTDYINANRDACFVVSNFINLSKECIVCLYDKKYIIYEHDHKYLVTRNPAYYENYIAPKSQIINHSFYKNARSVLCQSGFHKSIVEANLHLDNIESLSGNLWSVDSLDTMRILSKKQKSDRYAVMNSMIAHKNTIDAKNYCEVKEKPYQLIKSDNYYEFLSMLGSCKGFVFFPKTPETLSRVIVEARMMGLSVITNKKVGATQEEWYKLKGESLINRVVKMRHKIPNKVLEKFE